MSVWKWIQKCSNKRAASIPNRVLDNDDLAQDTAVAILTRPTGHDASRGTPMAWGTLIAKSVGNTRGNTARRFEQHYATAERPLDTPIEDDDAGERDERAYLFALLGELIGELDDDERAVIDYRYLSFATVPHLTETGKALDLGPACNVRTIEARAIAKLREGVMASSDDFDDELCAAADAAA